MAANRKGRRVMSGSRRGKIFGDFSKWGFDQKGWSPTTRKRYFARALACESWLAQNRQASIVYAKPKDLQAYLFSTKPTARNRNNIRQALVAFGEFMVDQNYSELNAALSLTRLPEPANLPRPLTNEQASRLDYAARIGGQEALIFSFLYAGLRKSEARLLERRSYEGDSLRIRGKGNKERMVPVHAKLGAALGAQLRRHAEAQWVFPSERLAGRPMSDTHVRILVRDVGDIAGIKGLHPHTLRHTFATRLSEEGVPLEVIQELLGHADPKTTRIYTKVRPKRFREAIALLDFAAEGAGGPTKVSSQLGRPEPLLLS